MGEGKIASKRLIGKPKLTHLDLYSNFFRNVVHSLQKRRKKIIDEFDVGHWNQ